MVLILFESPAGYSLFKADGKKVASVQSVSKYFADEEAGSSHLKLVDFKKFKTTADSLKNYQKILSGKLPKSLVKFLSTNIVEKEVQE
jgi:nucleolar protein 58